MLCDLLIRGNFMSGNAIHYVKMVIVDFSCRLIAMK